jgi:hypothetical protein
MPSGNLQLAYTNNQDVHITGNPQITFFKAVFKRHTNFAIESVDQTIVGDINYGRKFKVILKHTGDLLHQVYLVVDTKGTSTLGANSTYMNWVNNTAHALIDKITFSIGDTIIDEHDGVWLDIMSELNDPSHEDWPLLNKHAAKIGYLQSKTALVKNKLFIPLQFWFCRNPGMAFPIISLDRNQVDIVIEFTFRNFKSLINCDGSTSSITNIMPDVNVFADYIFLEEDERRMFVNSDQEYLIEQVQQLGGCGSYQNVKSVIDISHFNHPIKELVWVFRDKTAITENTVASNISNVDSTLNTDGSTFTQKNDFLNYDCSHGNNQVYIGGEAQYDHFSTMTLKLNGNDRFVERNSIYFRTVQPINYHGIFPYKKIYMFSFALRPSDQQPTGTLNFSAIDNATMVFNGIDTSNTVISVYAVGYNILRIIKSGSGREGGSWEAVGTGVAGLAYAD